MTVLVLAAAAAAPSAHDSSAIHDVVHAFDSHQVVAIAESHGLIQAGEFYAALARDTGFQRVAPVIVIEFASRQSQSLLDRYVVAGDSLPPDSVTSIWRNTTKVAAWESPAYAGWLAAIRGVNRSLPPRRRLRVLAGDTQVDWSTLHTSADWARLGDNNESFASIIADSVVARGRRAFVVLGSNHLMRSGDRTGGPNTFTRVERRFPGSTYVIWLDAGRTPAMPDAGWEVPSIHSLAGASFGTAADAILYLGPPDSLRPVWLPPEGLDVPYRRELDRRSWIEWGDSTRARRFLNLPVVPPAGTVTEADVPETGYPTLRHVWVYTPPGYPKTCPDGCDLVVAFDGGVYVDAMGLPSMLDSLIADGRIRPTVALMIEDASGTARLNDLANRAWFVGLVTDHVLPWLHQRWRVTSDPRRTIITGSSAGGLAAAYLAFARPDVFGNVASQSGAFWRGAEASNIAPYEWLTDQYAHSPRKPIRLVLDVGSTEFHGAMNGAAPSILDANRRLRDVLKAKGYDVGYVEVPGGQHAPESWRLRLPGLLAALSEGAERAPGSDRRQ
ncbi:MAG TPA: alpha/beta hydrolase-fold protein [Gemmatimonadales bacterium]|nr:alpha/beta hydrolase-fold protein [Gemmatimonadales bacterium]